MTQDRPDLNSFLSYRFIVQKKMTLDRAGQKSFFNTDLIQKIIGNGV
jgi:hypothetical protein